jgi:micrococcal nuclease
MHSFFCFVLPFLLSCRGPLTVTVTSVVDGDTIVAQRESGTEMKVRIVGIDTPETVDPRRPPQCYGPEASAETHALLEGKTVILETKPDEDKDKYGRLLRYVRLNGEDVGAQLIREGYAFSYRSFPHPRLKDYNALEKEAKKEKRGVWGPPCEYTSRGKQKKR